MAANDVELLRGLYERWNRGDFRDVVLDRDIVFARIMDEVPGGPGGPGEWHGAEATWQAIVEWLRHWDDVRIFADELVDLGDRVFVLSRQTARGKLSGVPVETELAEIFTIRDGKITRWEIYWDREDGRRAAGLQHATPDD